MLQRNTFGDPKIKFQTYQPPWIPGLSRYFPGLRILRNVLFFQSTDHEWLVSKYYNPKILILPDTFTGLPFEIIHWFFNLHNRHCMIQGLSTKNPGISLRGVGRYAKWSGRINFSRPKLVPDQFFHDRLARNIYTTYIHSPNKSIHPP